MRIFFIPGLSEEKWIFDKIVPFIDGEKVFIDNWTLLAEISEKGLNALSYAKFLIERFQINKQDLVIGHSMGGWVAVQIKSVISCPVIQISSFTDIKKVFRPGNRHLLIWLAKKGFGLNTVVMNILVFLAFRQEISKKVFKAVFRKTMREDKTTFAKQLQVVYNPIKNAGTLSPDLRIHAKKDQIIRPPDETFEELPGDHFALYAYPDKVYNAINNFIKNLS